MQVRAIDFIVVQVKDMGQAVAFYRDTLGLTPLDDPGKTWAEFEAGNATIALSAFGESAPGAAEAGTISFALAVPDVTAAVEELKGKQVPILMETFETGVCWDAAIADPGGNRIWLHQRKDGTAG